LITLHRDTLTFTFPEIGREVRSLIECKIKQIAAELPPTWDRTALISKIESHRDFSKLTTEEQECARERLRIWTSADVEDALEEVVVNRGGLTSDSFIRLSVKFQRAWRIANDNTSHVLRNDLGQLPLRSVDDFAETAPTSWLKNGGVVMPLAENEAPWIWFSSPYRFAIKIGFGDADALSSAPWGPALDKWPRNYLVVPDLSSEESSEVIRRFVNIPLDGESTPPNHDSENTHTEAIHLQITPVRAESYYEDERGPILRHNIEEFFMRLVFGRLISEQLNEVQRRHERSDIKDHPFDEFTSLTWKDARYQDIPVDPYRFAEWDQTCAVRCCVHLCDPAAWQELQRVKTRPHTEIREFLDAP
jgi:hypothetical protein